MDADRQQPEGSRLLGYVIPSALAVPAALLFIGMRLDVLIISALVMIGVGVLLSAAAKRASRS